MSGTRSPVAMAGVAAFLTAALVAARDVSADEPRGPVLFHASFDANQLYMDVFWENHPQFGQQNRYPNADFAVGSAIPHTQKNLGHVEDGRFEGAIRFLRKGALPAGNLGFDAGGNILPDRGTIAFWWRPGNIHPRDG